MTYKIPDVLVLNEDPISFKITENVILSERVQIKEENIQQTIPLGWAVTTLFNYFLLERNKNKKTKLSHKTLLSAGDPKLVKCKAGREERKKKALQLQTTKELKLFFYFQTIFLFFGTFYLYF